MQEDNPLNLPGVENAPMSPAVGVAAVALSLAIKQVDSTLVKDGVLYQQYKMEGKNIKAIGLEDVFETAIAFERHLMSAPNRLSDMILDGLASAIANGDLDGLGDEREEQPDQQRRDAIDQAFTMRAGRQPDHPGVLVRLAVLEPSGITVEQAAIALDHPLDELRKVMNGEASMTQFLADKIEDVYPQVTAKQLMQMQKDLDA
jgi:plasmid maintenance system antidote protein VapI